MLKARLHYDVLGTARLALGTVPLFFGTALHVYTYLFPAPDRARVPSLLRTLIFFHGTTERLHLRKSWHGTTNRCAETNVFGSARHG